MLYKRPRVDYKVSEYVFEYINKNILEPKKIMQTLCYKVHIFFDLTVEQRHEHSKYYAENSKFGSWRSVPYYRSADKYVYLFCHSTELNEDLKPKEYANIVYDMIGAYLIKYYKRITKEIMDKNIIGIDFTQIEKYKYPAAFKDQKYNGDGFKRDEEEYIKYYGE
jgi:hypothetical protein